MLELKGAHDVTNDSAEWLCREVASALALLIEAAELVRQSLLCSTLLSLLVLLVDILLWFRGLCIGLLLSIFLNRKKRFKS